MNQIRDLLMKINNCQNTCNLLGATILQQYDLNERRNQLKELNNCSEQCVSSSIILGNISRFSEESLILLSKLLESCGSECLHYPDNESQYCSMVCYQLKDTIDKKLSRF